MFAFQTKPRFSISFADILAVHVQLQELEQELVNARRDKANMQLEVDQTRADYDRLRRRIAQLEMERKHQVSMPTTTVSTVTTIVPTCSTIESVFFPLCSGPDSFNAGSRARPCR